MEYFVEVRKDSVIVRFLMDRARELGDCMEVVRSGQSFFHLSYDQLRDRGPGKFVLDRPSLAHQ